MNCPGCATAMTAITLDGHLGTKVDLDLCAPCQVIWFDHLESLRLAPGGVLRLFQVIADGTPRSPAPLKLPVKCPRCELRLLLTHDRQRNTPFRYWRCAREHGRLTTFFDFLREKDFVRPLSPQQLAELRANVQMINCSNCGAPIDLAGAPACAHCGTPISMIDLKQIEEMAAHLRRASEASRTVDPMLPERLAREKSEVEALFASLRADDAPTRPSSVDLFELGLHVISNWFR
jgi:DNA-directed RNA polymerase subunit RPC12/RpoP